MMADIVVVKDQDGSYRAMSAGKLDMDSDALHWRSDWNPRLGATIVERFVGEVQLRECERLGDLSAVAIAPREVAERLAGSGLVRFIEDCQMAVTLVNSF